MNPFKRLKEKLGHRSRDGSPLPSPSPLPGLGPARMPTISTNIEAVPVTNIKDPPPTDLWDRAWSKLRQEHFEEARVLDDSVQTVTRQAADEEGSSRRRDGTQIAQSISDTYDEYNKTHQTSQSIKVSFNKIISVVNKGKDVIAAAVSFNPIASSVWTGVSLIIPILMQPSNQNEAAIETLRESVDLLQCYCSYQRILEQEEGFEVESARDRIVDLYHQILLFEAQIISHRSKNVTHRLMNNMTNDWSEVSKKLKNIDEAFMRQFESIRAVWKRQEQEQRKRRHVETAVSDLYVEFRLPKGERLPGTGMWFLRRPEFLSWRLQKFALLWMTADPGCGKSVLTKYLIESTAELCDNKDARRDAILSFFFFSGGQPYSNATAAICSLLNQILTNAPEGISLLEEYCKKRGMKTGGLLRASTEVVWELFLDVLLIVSKDRQVICVMDALDECDPESLNVLLHLLDNLYSSATSSMPSLRFLVISRPYNELRVGLRQAIKITPNIRIDAAEEQESLKKEINLVIVQRVKDVAERKELTDESSDKLQRALCSYEHRTYLWLYLILEYFDTDWEHAEEDITKFINTIPFGVEQKYSQILGRMKSKNRSDASRLFQIMLAACRPLTTDEAYQALRMTAEIRSVTALSSGRTTATSTLIREMCGLFVYIDNESRLFFLHETARDYFLKKPDPKSGAKDEAWTAEKSSHDLHLRNELALVSCHVLLAEICTNYLFLDEVLQLPGDGDGRSGAINSGKDGPNCCQSIELHFLEYAACFWMKHTESAKHSKEDVLLRQVELLDHYSERHKIWFSVFCTKSPESIDKPDDIVPGLVVASTYGLCQVVDHLIQLGTDVNSRTEEHGDTALHRASSAGYLDIVVLLLQSDTQINLQGEWNRTALLLASDNEHSGILKVLLNNGAQINLQDYRGRTALILASACGYTDIVRTLLDKGATPDLQSRHGWTALMNASSENHIEVVKLLLRNGATVDLQDKDGWTALTVASLGNHIEIAKLLLRNGATVDLQDKSGRTTLMDASSENYIEVVKLLLRNSATVDLQDEDGWTALIDASSRNHIEIVKLLLRNGATVDLQDERGRTALMMAASPGFTNTVEALLEQGAEVDLQDKGGWTALMLMSMSQRGPVEIFKALLDRSAAVNLQDEKGRTALMKASRWGRIEKVKALLDKGAEIDLQDRWGQTALMDATQEGYIEIIRVLLEKGARLNLQDKLGRTALMFTSYVDSTEIVGVLLDAGTDIDLHDRYGRTALMEASRAGNIEIVKILLKRSAKGDLRDIDGRTALMMATTSEIAKVLTDYEATTDL